MDHALELTQSLYFEACDIAAGDSYKAIGYDSRAQYFDQVKARLAAIEAALTQALAANA